MQRHKDGGFAGGCRRGYPPPPPLPHSPTRPPPFPPMHAGTRRRQTCQSGASRRPGELSPLHPTPRSGPLPSLCFVRQHCCTHAPPARCPLPVTCRVASHIHVTPPHARHMPTRSAQSLAVLLWHKVMLLMMIMIMTTTLSLCVFRP